MEGFDDSIIFTPLFSDVCTKCKHLNPPSLKESISPKRTCKAFPNGIPLEIWSGKTNHKESFKGDNGITFSPLEARE